jgi:hypothetical protein
VIFSVHVGKLERGKVRQWAYLRLARRHVEFYVSTSVAWKVHQKKRKKESKKFSLVVEKKI